MTDAQRLDLLERLATSLASPIFGEERRRREQQQKIEIILVPRVLITSSNYLI